MVLPTSNRTKSYWIEAADSPLRDYRSSTDLPAERDIVIIGSGMAGVTAAYWIDKYTEKLAKQPRVALLEAQDVCGSATGRNGGQLRPHLYSRYPLWSGTFGPDGAMELIRHELAHLAAFEALVEEEGVTEEVCLKFGDTFDAAMTDEAWSRLRGAYQAMRDDHGDENDVVKMCRLIEDATEAEEFSQMKGAIGAVVHPAGQIWPYKFVHAVLRKLTERTNFNLQAHTPVLGVSERDSQGWITINTDRGAVRTKAVIHTTNRWVSHLLPEFDKLILPDRGTLAAIKAPAGFIKHTGAQHWDSAVNNYHLQLPPPYNTVILGGARQFLVHRPIETFLRDDDDKQIDGVAEFLRTWPLSDVQGWKGSDAELDRSAEEGGCWTGIQTSSADMFPSIGAVPNREGHWIAAGFAGHGMPRILLSTDHIVPLVLESLDIEFSRPTLASDYPPLPKPFLVTPERVERLQGTDVDVKARLYKEHCEESSMKSFCRDERSLAGLGRFA